MDALPYKFTLLQQIGGIVRFLVARAGGYPTLVNLEVTRRCNARCDFCRYWATRTENALTDYLPVIRRLRPSVVVFTGGEPLMRRDLESQIRRVHGAYPAMFIGLVTNGALLTVDRGLALWNAGLSQLTVSLDFLDQRHDEARHIPGLAQRIVDTLPELAARGVSNLLVQAVIKTETLDSIPDVIRWAVQAGIRVSLSAYTAAKNGNDSHCVTKAQMASVRKLIDVAVRAKGNGGAVSSSHYYLRRIAEYFEGPGIAGCPAGRKFVTVDPAGNVYRCSESHQGIPYEFWYPGVFRATDCRECWVPCRGESQAPLSWERVKQVAEIYARRIRAQSRMPVHSPAPGVV
jgi:MoaA/NifB/PqqE/SkfB family radical SAM enzyme